MAGYRSDGSLVTSALTNPPVQLTRVQRRTPTVVEIDHVCGLGESPLQVPFLFLELVAVVVHALIEREIRRAMKRARITKLPLYPEERNCAAPTADRIFELFAHLQLHQLRDGSRIVKTFQPELLPVHERIIELLGIPTAAFRRERA